MVLTARIRKMTGMLTGMQSLKNPYNEGEQMEPICHLHTSCCPISHLWLLFLGFEKAKCNICFSYRNFQFVAEELTMFASKQKRKNIIVFLTCLFLLPGKTQPYPSLFGTSWPSCGNLSCLVVPLGWLYQARPICCLVVCRHAPAVRRWGELNLELKSLWQVSFGVPLLWLSLSVELCYLSLANLCVASGSKS